MRLWTTGERRRALNAYDILDTPAEAAFDDIVAIARTLTSAPIALISFLDTDRQWFKAERGAGTNETPLESSFCAIAAAADQDLLTIADATADPRTCGMDVVTGEPHVRAYAGALLRSREGAPLGTLCVLDVKARHFAPAELEALRALARQVTALLELRRTARESAEALAALRDVNLGRELAMQAARLGRWDHRPSRGERFYDARAREILGLGPDDDISPDAILARIHPDDRDRIAGALEQVQHAGRIGPYQEQYRVIHPGTGEVRWVSSVGTTLFEDQACIRFFGVMEDVTERRRLDELRSFLSGELNHRVKNILSLAQSVVDATLRGAADLKEAREAVAPRMRALSQAHDVLLAHAWSAAPVREIVDGVRRDLSLNPARLTVDGPPVRLRSEAALQLALALHELATNAAKHGALSGDRGWVRLSWRLDGDETFQIAWEEQGGPAVCAPSRRGFGSRVIGRATEAAFQGVVKLDYAPAGLCWRLTAPMAGLRDTGEL